MMPFAVWHEGLKEGTGRWVLAVDVAESVLLLADDQGAIYRKPIEECTLVRIHTPDNPIPVVSVQMTQQNGLVMPEPNRMMRRNGNN